jgi:cytochrome c oxidase assembly protein subunit 15
LPSSAPRVSPLVFQKIATIAVACYVLLVVTGGAVRLTGSGLGCPDWPACYAHHFTAALSYHQRIEDTNRLVTVAVSVISIVVALASLLRSPRRRDLIVGSMLILGGLIAQIVLGGLVVLFKLNPYLVATHFLLTFGVLYVALALRHRASIDWTPGRVSVPPLVLWLARAEVLTVTVVVTIGTMVTGSGPHAGGTDAKRIPIAFRDIAELHSTAALFLIGLTLGTVFATQIAGASASVIVRVRTLLEALAIQGVLGFAQYALHDNPVIVELHLAGATTVWCCAWLFYFALQDQPSPSNLGPQRARSTADAILT